MPKRMSDWPSPKFCFVLPFPACLFACISVNKDTRTYRLVLYIYIYVCVCRCACRTWEDLSLVFDVLEDGPISSLQGFRVHGRFVDNIVQSHP